MGSQISYLFSSTSKNLWSLISLQQYHDYVENLYLKLTVRGDHFSRWNQNINRKHFDHSMKLTSNLLLNTGLLMLMHELDHTDTTLCQFLHDTSSTLEMSLEKKI